MNKLLRLLIISVVFALSAASALKTSAAPASPDASALVPAKADDQVKSLTAQLAAEQIKFSKLSRASEGLAVQRDQNAKLAQDAQLQLALAMQEIESLQKELAEAKAKPAPAQPAAHPPAAAAPAKGPEPVERAKK